MDPTTGFRGLPLCYLDIETTGLDTQKHEVIEISILKPAHTLPISCPKAIGWATRLSSWRSWTVRIKPERIEDACPYALELNGYDPDLWEKEGVTLKSALATLERYTEHSIVVGHNVYCDLEFIKEAHRSLGNNDFDIKYRIDTTTLIWDKLVPLGLTRGNLHDACEALGISNDGEHTSLADVLRTKAVLDALHGSTLQATGERYVETLKRIRALELARTVPVEA